MKRTVSLLMALALIVTMLFSTAMAETAELTYAEGITGFYTVIDTGREGPTVLILGELDSLVCFEHPDAAPVTGAVHCCGHSAQSAALLGVAAALKVRTVRGMSRVQVAQHGVKEGLVDPI